MILVIYLAFPTRNYYWDGMDFANLIEEASRLNTTLLHPNHLFYNVVGWFFYRLLNFLGWPVRAVEVLQILNSVCGTLGAFILFQILKSLQLSLYPRFALTFLFAFSANWWKFSTDADAYIPSVLFLLLSFYLILPTGGGGGGRARPLPAALTHSAAMLFHELAVLFYPAAVLGLYLQTGSFPVKKRILAVLQYSAAAFSITFFTYCVCFSILNGRFDPYAFFKWITYFTPPNSFSGDLSHNFTMTFRTHIRLFLEGRTGFLEFNPITILLAGLLVILMLIFIFKLGRGLKNGRFISSADLKEKFLRHPVALLCAVWIAPYLLFLFFFIPGNTFYRLFYLPALVILTGLLIRATETGEARQPRQWRLILLAGIIFLSNFLLFIYPYSLVRKNTPLFFAREIGRTWSGKTLVYYDRLNFHSLTVKYFNPSSEWKPLSSLTVGEIEEELRNLKNQGATVWFEKSAVDKLNSSEQTAQWLAMNTGETITYELPDPSHNLKFVQLKP